MNGDGYNNNTPTQGGLYWMRKQGSVDGGRVVEIVPPGKYRPPEGEQLFDLPKDGYEYKVLEGYASSVWRERRHGHSSKTEANSAQADEGLDHAAQHRLCWTPYNVG